MPAKVLQPHERGRCPHCPRTRQHVKAVLPARLAIDRDHELEQACIKVELPYVDLPQQSYSMAMPVLFMEGDSAADSDGLSDGIACQA
jgi:hypothetical protein